MPPSRALLDLISSRTSPSCLLAAARESLASIENDIALQMSTGSEADNVDEGGLRALESSNGSTQTRIKRSSEEGGGPGSSTPRNATGTEKENAPWLNKKDIERELKTPAEKMDVMTEETERKVSFWKDAENKYTIPQLEMQREVFVKDVSIPPPLSPLPSFKDFLHFAQLQLTNAHTLKSTRSNGWKKRCRVTPSAQPAENTIRPSLPIQTILALRRRLPAGAGEEHSVVMSWVPANG